MAGQGYVQVYTGHGKGKTTAMLGLVLRAAGAGLKVYIGQFLKNMEYSEIKAIKNHLPMVEVEQYGQGYSLDDRISMEDVQTAAMGLEKATQAMLSGKYDVIALDEVNMAVLLGFVSKEALLELISKKPYGIELILTGRYAMPEIVAAADLVTEMCEVKHYYNTGVTAREGIEL